MSNLTQRLAKVEDGRQAARGFVVVWKHSDENSDSAITRWMAQHPDRPDPRTTALTVYLISWQREWAAKEAIA
jgi:hypothetical protein